MRCRVAEKNFTARSGCVGKYVQAKGEGESESDRAKKSRTITDAGFKILKRELMNDDQFSFRNNFFVVVD